MKKSYFKLTLFSLTLIILFLVNSFIFHFLTQNLFNIFLLFLIGITYFVFGFEKDRHRYQKDIILELTILMISFFLLYYLVGIFIGFAKTSNYFNISSLKNIIIPIIFYHVEKEFLRYQLLRKTSLSKALTALIILLFILMDSVIPVSSHSFGFTREIFLVFALNIMPSITENIFCTFLSKNFGYLPSIFYLLVMQLSQYFLPIIPNPNEYLYSIIFFLYPLVMMRLVKNYLKISKTENTSLDYSKGKYYFLGYGFAIIILMILVYFVSGYFRYYTIAIASGSMENTIFKGDVVIIDKEYQTIDKNDILAYQYENKVVVHRVYKMIDTGSEKFIYTKGDANSNFDQYKVTEDMIMGVVKAKFPLIGYPTVLLNEKW